MPDADAPEPANVGAVNPRTHRPVVRWLSLAGAAALVILCVIVAMNWSGRPPVGEPSAEMWPMGCDVSAGPWRVRVDGVDWSSDPASPRDAMLSVRLTLTNSSASELPTPAMSLGNSHGKSLAAEFGQPVLKTSVGEAIFRVASAATVSGRLLFPAPRAEYCLIVAPEGAEPVLINLTVSNPRLKNGPASVPTPAPTPVSPVAAWARRHARLRKNGLTVVIVLDTTRSMEPAIGELKKSGRNLAAAIGKLVPGARVGLVNYGEGRTGDDDPHYFPPPGLLQCVTLDGGGLDRIQRYVQALTVAGGGGDAPAQMSEGIMYANGLAIGWTRGERVIVVVGGSRPAAYRYEDSFNSICAEMKARGDRVSFIDAGGESRVRPEFVKIANASGGEACSLKSPDALALQILSCIFRSGSEKDVAEALRAAFASGAAPPTAK